MLTLGGQDTYIKEDYVSVSISVTFINPIKSLGELHITDISADLWIH